MARGKLRDVDPPRTLGVPARTPEEREQQLVAAAHDLAEQQILEGTASAQVITHFLKLGSTRERLEQERLKRENILLEAKAEAMETGKIMVELYDKAIEAMRSYSGQSPLGLGSEVVDDEELY